jgi:hypothetical protein
MWYDEELPAHHGIDIALYMQRHAPIARAECHASLTLITALDAEPDVIHNRFDDRTRYEIRRADAKDGLRYDFLTDPESQVDAFCAFYDAFAAEKSIALSDHPWLIAACQARALVLTAACRNDEALVWHAYLVQGKTARCQYSGSCFRQREGSYRSLVSRANRWLHWQDMLRLKAMGIERYDWGGIFGDDGNPEHAGVDTFKKGFGGTSLRTYDCVLPVTLKGRLYLPLRNAWRRQGKKRWDAYFGKPARA